MSDTRKYSSYRQIFSYDALVNGSGQTTIVCLNRDILPILIEFLATRGQWRTSYFTSQDAQHYTLPDATEFSPVLDIVGDAINALQLGYTMATCDAIVQSLEALNVTVKEMRDSINSLSGVTAGVACGCGPQGTNPNPTDNSVACVTPAGFNSWADFVAYSCRALNWIFDKLIIALRQIEQSWFLFYFDFQTTVSNKPLSVTEVYQRNAANNSAMFPLEWLFNMGDNTKSNLNTDLTDLYLSFRADKFLRVPEFDTVDDVISDWYAGVGHYADYFEANKSTVIQDLFETQTATELLTEFNDALGLAQAYAAAQGTGASGLPIVDALVTYLVDVGITSLGFARSVTLDNYLIGTYVCTGDKGCCPAIAPLVADQILAGRFQAVYDNGLYRVDLINNATAIGSHCDVTAQWTVPTLISGVVDNHEFFDDTNSSTSSGSGLPGGATCVRRMLLTSSVPFTVDVSVELCS